MEWKERPMGGARRGLRLLEWFGLGWFWVWLDVARCVAVKGWISAFPYFIFAAWDATLCGSECECHVIRRGYCMYRFIYCRRSPS